MNPLRFLLAVVRAIQAIVNNLFGSPAAAEATVAFADEAARWRRRQHQAYRRSLREQRKGCRHGRQTRCSARSRRRRTERPLVRRPIACAPEQKRLTVEARQIPGSREWEVVQRGRQSALLRAPSALAAEQRAAELLESRSGGIVLVANSTGKIVFALQVIPGWRWPLGADYLPESQPPQVNRRRYRVTAGAAPKCDGERIAAVLKAVEPASTRTSCPSGPARAASEALPGYELRKGRAADEWVLVRRDSGTQLLAAQGKQRMIGRSTALLRGTGGGSVRVLNDAGEAESIVEVRPAGPPLGGYMVSQMSVKAAQRAHPEKTAQSAS